MTTDTARVIDYLSPLDGLGLRLLEHSCSKFDGMSQTIACAEWLVGIPRRRLRILALSSRPLGLRKGARTVTDG